MCFQTVIRSLVIDNLPLFRSPVNPAHVRIRLQIILVVMPQTLRHDPVVNPPGVRFIPGFERIGVGIHTPERVLRAHPFHIVPQSLQNHRTLCEFIHRRHIFQNLPPLIRACAEFHHITVERPLLIQIG